MSTKKLVHGTYWGYKRGCRCEPCHQALLGYSNTRYAKLSEDPEYRAYKTEAAKKGVAKKREVLSALKAVPCMDCGLEYPSYVMDFDHRPGTVKEISIASSVGSTSLERLLLEVDKCDVVCANCHRERTHRRRNEVIGE